ncbi:30S ribosomal protein S2 [Candidatus Parcubacteria bacterium]|nr:30S ribosomal protein S2 [Candidatus Parcubacteria bacterium]
MTDKKETKEKQKKEKETKKEKPKEEKKEVKKVAKKAPDFKIDVDEMLAVGVHFGHRTSRLHPKMEPYLAGVKNTVHIIDLEKTAEKLKEALKFIQEIISENKVLLLVGTKIQIKDLVKEIAQECELPYVNERWLGGTLTNFEVISKRVGYLKEIEEKKASGAWEKYTKKERIKMNREFQNLKTKFEGLKTLSRVPDTMFVLDIRKDDLAVKEAKMKGIKVIAICDTNTDPSLIDYPIPANDDAISSVKYILEKVKEAILKTKAK